LLHAGRLYADPWDRTLVSLGNRKLVKYTHGRRYGKGGWTLTASGTVEANKIPIPLAHMDVAEQVRVLGADSLLPDWGVKYIKDAISR
jgi:hypothetical protein